MVGAEAVLAAVRNCWASLWTDRAVSYRAEPRDRPLHRGARRRRPAHGGCRRRRSAVHREPGDRPAAGGGHRCQPGPGRGGGFRGREPGPLRGGRRVRTDPGAPARETNAWPSARCPAGERNGSTSRPAGATPCLTDSAAPRNSPRWARRPRSTSARRRTLEWAIDADGKAWLTQSRPITTLYPLPDKVLRGEVSEYGHPRLPVLQPGPGADPPAHPDGPGRLPAHRLVRGNGGSALMCPDPRQRPPSLCRGRPAHLLRPDHRRAQHHGPADRPAGFRRHGGALRGCPAPAVRGSRGSPSRARTPWRPDQARGSGRRARPGAGVAAPGPVPAGGGAPPRGTVRRADFSASLELPGGCHAAAAAGPRRTHPGPGLFPDRPRHPPASGPRLRAAGRSPASCSGRSAARTGRAKRNGAGAMPGRAPARPARTAQQRDHRDGPGALAARHRHPGRRRIRQRC